MNCTKKTGRKIGREENKRSRFLTKLIAHMKNEHYAFTSPALCLYSVLNV